MLVSASPFSIKIMPLRPYQIIGYLALTPFLLTTYLSWCGPMDKIDLANHAFLIYSSLILVFIAGSWWGFSFSQKEPLRLKMMVVAIMFSLAVVPALYGGMTVLSVLFLCAGHLCFWLLEFLIADLPVEPSYRTQRTIVTLTIFVSHLLILVQFIPA